MFGFTRKKRKASITLEDSYQLFKKYKLTHAYAKSEFVMENEQDRSISFEWGMHLNQDSSKKVKTIYTFRDDLHAAFHHLPGFLFAHKAIAYSEGNPGIYPRFSCWFELADGQVYAIDLKSCAIDWTARFEIGRYIIDSDQHYAFEQFPTEEIPEKIRSLQKELENVLFTLPEYRLAALTGALKVRYDN